ncbi:uncharacterized protein LOC130200617 [Pseudoliparis swirei]|uniref:uncharacterized protein LOC130200617 n=1 Tax=Pseudoliparis swirei TaxID=2059687 RepID=UPI0024BEF948|nr:uncharacterized protein LOC130200617 [Pseudoliparis swirei]XP_056281027.1 uncharacterized protein LOC130200617 [Pseudoliparis swirei]
MDNTVISKMCGGNLIHLKRLMLLLLLAGLQPVRSTAGEEPEPQDDLEQGETLTCAIEAPLYVTVGVPSSVECDSDCRGCSFSLSLDGQSAHGQGSVLAFTVDRWVEALTVTCTVVSGDNRPNATTTKRLQVLAGPANVSIAGPDLMHPSVSHTYSCHAYCRPSCTYSWRMDEGPWLSGQGNVISITPQETDDSKLLLCKATSGVSGLFVFATRNIAVISGPQQVQIHGPDVIEIAQKYEFECAAECRPACRYVSSVDGQSVRGGVFQISVDRPLASVTLRCEAQNTASKRTATAVKTVQITGSDRSPLDRSPAARPEGASAVLLLAFIVSAGFVPQVLPM